MSDSVGDGERDAPTDTNGPEHSRSTNTAARAGAGGLGRNTALNFFPRMLTIVVALALSPFIVAQVGLAAFGFWSVVLGVLEFARVAGVGMPTIATRFVAAESHGGEIAKIRSAVLLALLVSCLVGVVVVTATGAVPFLLPVSVTDELPNEWHLTILLAGISLALQLVANALASAPRGYNRWELESAVVSVTQVFQAVFTVAFLLIDPSVVQLAVAACLANAWAVLGYVLVGRHLGALRVRGVRLRDEEILTAFFSQGPSLQVVGLVGAVNAQADRFLLLPFASLSWIGAYALGARIATSVRALPLSALGPLLSRYSSAHSGGGMRALGASYGQTMRLLWVSAVPLLLVICAASFPMVFVWLGTDYEVSAATALVLGITYSINFLTGPGTIAAVVGGRAQLDRNYNLLGLAINVSLTFPLGFVLGPWGVVLATVVGMVLSSTWLLFAVDRWLPRPEEPGGVDHTTALRSWLVAVAIGSLSVAISSFVMPEERMAYFVIGAFTLASGILAFGRPFLPSRLRRLSSGD